MLYITILNIVPRYSVGLCCLLEMEFYLGICCNQQNGICWCRIREGGYLTASQHALSRPLMISHPKLFFWCDLGNTKADGTSVTKSYFPPVIAKIACAIDLPVDTILLSSLLSELFFPESLFSFSLSIHSRSLYSPIL